MQSTDLRHPQYTFLLLFLLLAACSSTTKNPKDLPFDLQHYNYDASSGIDRLHKLKLGDIDSVRNSYEFDLAFDGKILYEAANEYSVSPEQKQSIYGMLRLMSVLNEKYPVKAWQSDSELLEIFSAVQKLDPAQTEDMRCRDWSKPMWVGSVECARNK